MLNGEILLLLLLLIRFVLAENCPKIDSIDHRRPGNCISTTRLHILRKLRHKSAGRESLYKRRALDATPRATSACGGSMKADEGVGPVALLVRVVLCWGLLICDCSRAAPAQHRIQMMVAMPYELGPPWQNPFLLTRSVAEPVIQLAIDDVSRKGFLNNIAIDLHFRNTNCSDTLGPYYAVEAYCAKQLDVVLGFASAYALAPVARLSGFWSQGVPVITTIAQVDSLDDRSVYKLLTRMNGSYRELGSTIIHLLQLLNYETVAFLFHSNLRRPAFGKSECFFQMVAINNQLLKASGWQNCSFVYFVSSVDLFKVDDFYLMLCDHDDTHSLPTSFALLIVMNNTKA
ncbi:conserved hypothetical protein [Trichinella spiralis]|uniref:hypothetical protein n=1 Tax=Trichinella spiralis TaxID=6334 RepID=UPI0001EFEA9B|nr:conserved hypothetical protein [Trichinella spiralis]